MDGLSDPISLWPESFLMRCLGESCEGKSLVKLGDHFHELLRDLFHENFDQAILSVLSLLCAFCEWLSAQRLIADCIVVMAVDSETVFLL